MFARLRRWWYRRSGRGGVIRHRDGGVEIIYSGRLPRRARPPEPGDFVVHGARHAVDEVRVDGAEVVLSLSPVLGPEPDQVVVFEPAEGCSEDVPWPGG